MKIPAYCPLFKPSHRMDIIISDIGLLAMGLGWYMLYKSVGFWIIFKLYTVYGMYMYPRTDDMCDRDVLV